MLCVYVCCVSYVCMCGVNAMCVSVQYVLCVYVCCVFYVCAMCVCECVSV